MPKYRLINCDFLNASSFKCNVSNKAKLLYLMLLTSADDKGYVDTANDLINALTSNEKEFGSPITLDLLENTYNSALCELIDKGYIYEFKDNHNNKVYLIRHWFYHNKLIKGLRTNYRNFDSQVHIEENEYVLGKKPLKEDKINQNNINQIKLNQSNVSEETEETEMESKLPDNFDELSKEEQTKIWDKIMPF